MANKKVNDGTDAFDARIKVMGEGRGSNATQADIDAAITVYERVRTARAICQALLPESFSEASVVALAVEIGAELRSSKN